jgi:hypothetical protein
LQQEQAFLVAFFAGAFFAAFFLTTFFAMIILPLKKFKGDAPLGYFCCPTILNSCQADCGRRTDFLDL